MLIEINVIDGEGKTTFYSTTEINPEALVEVAKSRESLARSKGESWTRNAIAFFGKELIKTAANGKLGVEIEKAATEVALVTWIHESIYCGLDSKIFFQSNLKYTMTSNAVVLYQRYPAKNKETTLNA